jgi:GAF domain-containing protein
MSESTNAGAEPAKLDRAKRWMSLAHERSLSLCAPFLHVLPVTGASVSILTGPGGQSTVCSSDPTAARLDELQFDLGEGPCWAALAGHRPVIAADLRTSDSADWPMFAEAVTGDERMGAVAAMYAFPLVVGSLDIGAVDLYSSAIGPLTDTQVSDASSLAGMAAWQVLRRILREQDPESAEDLLPATSTRREVHQATGMILAQLNISADDALLLLRAHAFASGRSVREIADDVVGRRLDFSTRDQP